MPCACRMDTSIAENYHRISCCVFSEDEYYDFDTVPKNRIPKSVRFQFGTGVYKEPRDLPQGKDPNCEACQGKHRAHTCGRGKSGLSTGHLPVNGRALPTGSSAPLPPDTTAADADSNDEHFEYERCNNPACEFHSGHTDLTPRSHRIPYR